MNSKRAIGWTCAIFVVLAASPANADKAFRDQFKAKYIKPDSTDPKDVALREAFQEAGCNVCHVGDDRENRNAYGQALAKFLSRKTDKKNRSEDPGGLGQGRGDEEQTERSRLAHLRRAHSPGETSGRRHEVGGPGGRKTRRSGAARQHPFRFRRAEAAANAIAPAASRASVPGSGTAAAVPPTALPPPPCDSGGAPPSVAMFSYPALISPTVAGADAAALRAAAPEPAGDEAASNAPMPEPLPKTSRPPPLIVTNPLPGKALAAAMSSVPPLIVVPPVYVFVPLRVNSPLPESAKRIVADDVPGERRRAGGRSHRQRRG